MCGIAGVLGKGGVNASDGCIDRMLDSIAHRGPDDRNVLALADKAVLGHLRLSIIDINNGAQPMTSADGRYHLVFNGEIYNYLELRQRLVSKGYQFKTYSDTEVLLQLYIEYGDKMLNYLNGMFAFVIYDELEEIAFAARDHFGIKPFYYTCANGKFYFASEIKALIAHPEVDSGVNDELVHEYLTFQFLLGENTLFKSIQKIEPAHYIKVRGGEIIENKQYWSLDYTINSDYSEEKYADELLLLLESSLSIQTRSDVAIGSYLSGGLDSSIVATLASKNYFGEFKTFCGGFNEGEAYDETKHAQLVSKDISSQHFEIFPTHNDFIDQYEKLIYHMDEPAAGPGLFPQYMVSKLASEHVKVVLGGQGGDEMFGGYARYAVAYLEQCMKGGICETQDEGNHVVTLESIIPNLPMLKQYLPMIKSQFSSGLFEDMDRRYFRLVDRSPNLGLIYNHDFLETRQNEKIISSFQSVFNSPETPSYFNKMTHFDMKTLLPALLHVEDRVSMAVSIESRVPLLDKRVIELAAQMPPTMKFAGGKTKYMLIESVKNILPKQIIERKDKMGFPTPFNLWLAGPLKDYALDILTSQKAKERGMFNNKAIEKLISNNQAFGRDIWGALSLEVWYRTFHDN